MRRFPTVIFTFLLLSIFTAFPAIAERRIALVIGNGAYQNVPRLPNPKNDAEDVSAALTRSGFEVIVGLDLDRAGMENAIIRFSRAARDADVAMFYYSGHAMQFAGVNYLAPVDAKLTDEADLRRMTRVDEIVADVQQAKNLRILVLDSCRDNPLAEQLRRSIGATRAFSIQRGLARIDSPQGMIVSYATQAGQTAEDGTGRNSPYTTAFLRHIETQQEIGTVFRRISADVYEMTKRTQLPELSLSFIGEFHLRGRVEIAVQPSPAPQVQSPIQPQPDPAERAWATIQNTTSVAVLEDFIRQFGDTPYGSMARARVEELKKSQVAAVAPPVVPAAPPSPVQPAVGVYPDPPPQSQIKMTVLSPERERALKPKETFKECEACPEMVVVPAGSFIMGSPANEKERDDDEGPQHPVSIAAAFAVGKFEVTFVEWDACARDGGCDGYRPDDKGWGRSTRPVINVGWDDAKAYVAWLSRRTGKTYRLLSEAEWEYIARAGTRSPFWRGSVILTSQANYDGSVGVREGQYRERTMPVSSFQPNPFGLYQVHGNVREWTEDCWNNSYVRAPTDGSAWTNGECGRRVLRGGSWYDSMAGLRSASRFSASSAIRDGNGMVGFRVARTLVTP